MDQTFTTIGNTGTHQLVLICINPTRSLSYTFTESRGGACFFSLIVTFHLSNFYRILTEYAAVDRLS